MKQVSEDLVKVIIDYRNSPNKDTDTGGFTLIYQTKDYTKN